MSHGPSNPGDPEERVTAGIFRRGMRALSFFLLLLAVIMFPQIALWLPGVLAR